LKYCLKISSYRPDICAWNRSAERRS
jgi:hypothetical protein